MTLNDSWGYQAADDNWKTSKTDYSEPDQLCAEIPAIIS